jgi:hypothetical protein
MEMVKKCPSCQRENQPEAAFCAFCGAALLNLLPAVTTEPVPDVPLKIKPPEHIVQLTKLYSDIVVLVVLGQEQPILIKGGEKTTLGRYSPGDIMPSIDLTPYNANLLGVSRQHATISRSETGYLLEDIGSTNGTWLNEVKLPPNKAVAVQSGDLIRLGQLGLYVYFDTGPADTETETEFVLRKVNLELNYFDVQDLSTLLLPYLSALAGVQSVCDSLSNRKPHEINITSFQFDHETGRLKIKISGLGDAFRLLKTKIIPWQMKSVKQVSPPVPVAETNPPTVSPPDPVQPAAPEVTVQPATNGQDNTTDEQRKNIELEHNELQFVNGLVSDLAPDRPDENKKEFTEKLLSHVHNLIVNPLQFVATD